MLFLTLCKTSGKNMQALCEGSTCHEHDGFVDSVVGIAAAEGNVKTQVHITNTDMHM